MVKNTKGGSKQKSIARKTAVPEHASRDPVPSNECEFIAKVDKMLGNGMCHVIDIETQVLFLCHIRGKFRGKRKSHNFITTASFVLVAKRSWQSQDKKECDLLSILNNTYGDVDADDAGAKGSDVVFTNEVGETTFLATSSQAHIADSAGNPTTPFLSKDEDDVVDFDDI